MLELVLNALIGLMMKREKMPILHFSFKKRSGRSKIPIVIRLNMVKL